jgi:RHS repeat-associated protein
VYADAEGGLPEWAVLGSYDNGSASGTGRSEYIWLPDEGGGAIQVGLYRNGSLYAIHADHLGTPRLMTDGTNQVVWQWPYSAFGNNRPTGVLEATANPYHATTIDPEMLKATPPAVSLELRFPGQMVDGETGTFYNYHRSYLAGQGRYTQFDPIGLRGGPNGYAYVGGNPLSLTDPMGLAQILEPQFGSFDEARKWRQRYRDLYDANNTMRERIKKYCPDQLAKFDNWRINIDPNIDAGYLRRARSFATTRFRTQSSQFNWAFFNREPTDPSGPEIFAHEFRHLMDENNRLFRQGDAARDPATVPGEMDADAWAKKFWSEQCECTR